MSNKIDKLLILTRMIGQGEYRIIFKEIKRRFYSNEYSYCLSRNLDQDFQSRKARIPITIRPLAEKDIPLILNYNSDSISGEALKERSKRLLIYNAGIKQCYVAVDENDQPCFIQWLIGPEENQKVQTLFKGGFPVLEEKERLLEGAYTHESYRGKGIMPEAMAKIAELGKDSAAKTVITFVQSDNVPSLKGCQRAGFHPTRIRKDHWRFFFRKVKFEDLPPDYRFAFEK